MVVHSNPSTTNCCAVPAKRCCYNNTASLHVYSAFHRYDRNNHSGFHIHILVYKHVNINVYKHIHIDLYKHDHHFM
ncbi:hypothetical protein WR25_02375 [Diploscapter pachys]|uniref:Uncharacterized protein n=1 Tax=Diploscapter pachys TaxID=2018661 RepID=A0A2A2LM03_9BILA|nr:hypothetical protein WR25_02375 [Diploscapter pachys]